SHRNKSLSSNVLQLYYNGFIPFCVYTTYFTLPIQVIEFPQSMKDELYFILEMIDSNERQLRWWEANKKGSNLKVTNENHP
ncbi:MAG: hypothetical protein DI612_05195, partial [Streptococcus thermophilus]